MTTYTTKMGILLASNHTQSNDEVIYELAALIKVISHLSLESSIALDDLAKEDMAMTFAVASDLVTFLIEQK